jgi:hypothetical protein
VLASNRQASCRAKFCKHCLYFGVGCKFTAINRVHCGIDDPQFLLGGEILAILQFTFDLIGDVNEFVLCLFGPRLNAFQKGFEIPWWSWLYHTIIEIEIAA